MFDQLLEKYHIEEVIQNKVGHSQDGVYFLKSASQNYYLKISSNQEIINEVKSYRYLEGKLNVPKVYEFDEADGYYYLLMSEVKGKMLYECLEADIEGTIQLYALALKQIHQLPFENYPIKRDLSEQLSLAKENMKDIDITTLEEITQERGLSATYQRLVELSPKTRDLVICHGDFCMPNIVVGESIGFIDLGRSGVDDRHQDIALALRSLKTNIEMIGRTYQDNYQQLFLDTYGINEIDEQKREFYFLLDEFF